MNRRSDVRSDGVRPIAWDPQAGCLCLLDQRVLPARVEWLRVSDCGAAADAIRDMVVRGAPAIGITAAYAVALAARNSYRVTATGWRDALNEDLTRLAAARPTAVNLAWAVAHMRGLFSGIDGDPFPPLLAEAERLHQADIAANRRMGALGAELIDTRCSVLTHCNAGALATGGYGTALGVVRSLWSAGRLERVYADETRPWLQGARLTAWELVEEGIPVSLIADGAAAWAMRSGKVAWVIVGADRIAANGDVANKIGTCAAAACARRFGVRFMVAAPTSTIDRDCPTGEAIPIECRDPDELLRFGATRTAAPGAEAWNPVFDVTPADLVDVIVTERGVVRAPDTAGIARLFA